MKQFILLIFALNLIAGCKSSQKKTQLIIENKALIKRIKTLEYYDSLNVEPIVELKKMNVVYRGVSNPISITIPQAKEVIAMGKGLKKINKNGTYIMNPGTGLEFYGNCI